MHRPVLPTVVATAAIAAGLALVPAAAHAAGTTSGVTVPTTTSASVGAGSPVVATSQTITAGRVVLSVQVAESGVYVLRDGAGHLVKTASGDPGKPAVYVLRGTGTATADFRVTRQDGSGSTAVRVDFGAVALAAPTDSTSAADQTAIRRAVLAGQTEHAIVFQARPGATVALTTNGVVTTAVADADGAAAVPVSFTTGVNELSVVQELDGLRSQPKTSTYSFVA